MDAQVTTRIGYRPAIILRDDGGTPHGIFIKGAAGRPDDQLRLEIKPVDDDHTVTHE